MHVGYKYPCKKIIHVKNVFLHSEYVAMRQVRLTEYPIIAVLKSVVDQ